MDSYRNSRSFETRPRRKQARKRGEKSVMNEKSASLPTITSQKIGTVIGDGEIVSEKGESTVSPSGAPLLDLSLGGTLESAEERHKHVPVERVPHKPCTAEHPLLTIPNKRRERGRVPMAVWV